MIGYLVALQFSFKITFQSFHAVIGHKEVEVDYHDDHFISWLKIVQNYSCLL